jgi:hypothetical protein
MKKLYLISLLLFLQSCRSDRPIVQDVEQDFYDQHPTLKGKIADFSGHVYSPDIWEIARYYRFTTDEAIISSFLKQGQYINTQALTQGDLQAQYYRGSDNKRIYFDCRAEFISGDPNVERSLRWWDLKVTENTNCYTKLPLNMHRQNKAVYDRSRKVLFVYEYTAR